MNVYLMNEDGESFCIKALTMAEALSVCEQSYLKEIKKEFGSEYDEDGERKYYHEHILQSCSLIAELKN